MHYLYGVYLRSAAYVDRLGKLSSKGTTAFENTTLYSQSTCNHLWFTHTIRATQNTADPYHTTLTCLSLMTWSNLLKANGLNFISSPSKSKLLWRISFGLSSSLVMWSTRCFKTKQNTYRHINKLFFLSYSLFHN